jgi:hypothetical protein
MESMFWIIFFCNSEYINVLNITIFLSLQGDCSGDVLLSRQNLHRWSYKTGFKNSKPITKECFVRLNKLDIISLKYSGANYSSIYGNNSKHGETVKQILNAEINTMQVFHKQYKCNQCDYTTALKGNLTKHINALHSIIKPNICSRCDYSTTHKGNLTTHINAVHSLIKPYKCSQCDYSATHKGNLTTHTNAVHSLIKPY